MSPVFVSPRQACAMLGVSRSTLLRWETEGKLKAYRLCGSGHRRYLVADLRGIINGRAVAA